MQRKKPQKGNGRFVHFDFESEQETGQHIMNYAVARIQHCDKEGVKSYEYIVVNDTGVWKAEPIVPFQEHIDAGIAELEEYILENFSFTRKPIDVEYNGNGQSGRDNDDRTIDYFCKYFMDNKFGSYTFIAHYGKGFDFHPIAGWLVANKVKPYTITNGNKISYMHISNLNIRFIDSINFTMIPLKLFPSTFGFKGHKGHFPHVFNRKENQYYEGAMPPLKDYGYDTMAGLTKEARLAKERLIARKLSKTVEELTKTERPKKSEKEELAEWYASEEGRHKIFNFQ
jgi:hypothetical protein